jgi:hypothetical protein
MQLFAYFLAIICIDYLIKHGLARDISGRFGRAIRRPRAADSRPGGIVLLVARHQERHCRSGLSTTPRGFRYAYHWQDAKNQLLARWDNAPHHPQLAGPKQESSNGIDPQQEHYFKELKFIWDASAKLPKPEISDTIIPGIVMDIKVKVLRYKV